MGFRRFFSLIESLHCFVIQNNCPSSRTCKKADERTKVIRIGRDRHKKRRYPALSVIIGLSTLRTRWARTSHTLTLSLIVRLVNSTLATSIRTNARFGILVAGKSNMPGDVFSTSTNTPIPSPVLKFEPGFELSRIFEKSTV